MIYAIIAAGGTQFRVEPGRFYDLNRLHEEPETSITIDDVLLVQNDGDVAIGQPFVAGATVQATIMRHFRGRKIIVYKMRPKKKTRKKQGHRQELTRLMINSITLDGVVIASDDGTLAPAPSPVQDIEVASISVPDTLVEETELSPEATTPTATLVQEPEAPEPEVLPEDSNAEGDVTK